MEVRVIYDVFHNIYWGLPIVLDLFLGGIGAGAFLTAALISIFYGDDEHNEVSKIAAIVAPIALILAWFCLMFELGHPLRIWKALLNMSIRSPLSWGGWASGALIITSITYAVLWRTEFKIARRLIGYIGIPLSVIVGLYHGFLLSIVKAKPIWFTGPSTVLALTGFVTTGIAVIVLILGFRKKCMERLLSIKITRDIMGVAIVVHLFALFLWFASNYYGYFEMSEALSRLNSEYGLMFWGGSVFIGLILPLMLGAFAIYRERKTKRIGLLVPILTSIMVLFGGFVYRYVWLHAGQLY